MRDVLAPARGRLILRTPGSGRSWVLPALFGATAFLGAGLLFVVQPLAARLLLPSYGGSATVWSTSSLLFQVLLLAAYLYAHLSTRLLGPRRQPAVHLVVLLLPLLALPMALPGDAAPNAERSPVLWLLWTLALMVGLPFVVVSTTGPLLQRWYSWTDGPRSDDPYFLFAASNFGSFGGLLAYPLLIEPTMTLETQRLGWSGLFVVYIGLAGVCAGAALRGQVAAPALQRVEARPSVRRQLNWLWWAFLPSALMLAVTSHIATDVASIPLIWVVPLAIYLATFVAAFSTTTRRNPVTVARSAVAVSFTLALTGAVPWLGGGVAFAVTVAMLALALVGYTAHRRLANDRPEPASLTLFFVVIAVGGALGGVLNGLVAPLVFDRLLEYPVLLTLIPLLVIGLPSRRAALDRLVEQRQRLSLAVLLVLVGVTVMGLFRHGIADGPPVASYLAGTALFGVLAFRVATRPVPLFLALVLVAGLPLIHGQLTSIEQSRTFYGSYRVFDQAGLHVLVHGTTIHGTQYLDGRRSEPTTYYSRSGPIGEVWDTGPFRRVAVVGLGVGTLAAYSEPTTDMTFIEIDPEVVRIAQDPTLFTYLRDAEGSIDILVGDGRLMLEDPSLGELDLVVLDAFSSDAIPIHLLTVEAIAGYGEKLGADGLLAVHISNRLFNLLPVLRGTADSLGWSLAHKQVPAVPGRDASDWVVLSPSSTRTKQLVRENNWSGAHTESVSWTDDKASILDVIK